MPSNLRTNAATVVLDKALSAAFTGRAEQIYRDVHPKLLEPYDRSQGQPIPRALLVAAVAPEGVQTRVLAAGDFLVIGRHTRCALSLQSDDALSLRHIAVRWTWEADRPLIRLWDLQAGAPFVTEDGRETRAVVAEELLFGTLGKYGFAMVPYGGAAPSTDPTLAWGSLPLRRFEVVPGMADRTRAPGAVTTSHTRPPMVFGESPSPDGPPMGSIEVELAGGRVTRVVSGDQLDRGLLFGRYDRCQLPLTGDRLSRVHLMVVRIGDQVWAIDTASTFGVRRNGIQVDSVALTGTTSLLLASGCVVRWRPLGSPFE